MSTAVFFHRVFDQNVAEQFVRICCDEFVVQNLLLKIVAEYCDGSVIEGHCDRSTLY